MLLPLKDIYFEGGVPNAKGKFYENASQVTKQGILKLLAHLANSGSLIPGDAPPLAPALVIRALRTGSSGNSIQVTFRKFDIGDPVNPKFEAVVAETDVYNGLTLDTLQKVIGAKAGDGSRPGLVRAAAAD
jgi:hypothetical protein